MRRSRKEHDAEVQVALGLVALALLIVGLILVSGSEAPASDDGPKPARIAQQLSSSGSPAAERRNRGKRGKRGKRGPRGGSGQRGPEGRAGADGSPGAAAGPARQFISIDWQNGDYVGHDRQTFVAPGIGTGEVRCTPPNDNEPTGVQWIRFYPYDAGSPTEGPSNWATTMWTTRNGGNLDGGDRFVSVVRTARLDRANQQSGFNESMNTASVGYDPTSVGLFTGLITTEPFSPTTAKPPSTSFRLTWHWNFGYNDPNGRCYMAGTFLTKGS